MLVPLLVLCSAAIVYLLRPSNLALSSGASPPAPPFFLELLTRTRVRSCALIPTEVTHLSGSNVVKDTVLFRVSPTTHSTEIKHVIITGKRQVLFKVTVLFHM